MNTMQIKSALIIGGSDGIGLETVKRLKASDYEVINISRSACECADFNCYCDISDGNLSQIVRSCFEENPFLSTVLYFAGCSLAAPVEYITARDREYLFEVNFFGFCDCVKTALPFMKESGGYIACVSSLGAEMPIAFDAYYSASKAAIDMFVRETSIEVAPYNIKLASFRPGGVATDFTFKRKIYDYDAIGSYAEPLSSAVERLKETEQKGDKPEKVADFIVQKLLKGKGGVFNIGWKNSTLSLASSIMPTAVTDTLTRKFFS